MGPFDRFNDRAKRVLALAQDEAIRFNHNYIGTEHLLLGLVREGEGVAARVLDSLGVDLSRVRRAIEFTIGRGNWEQPPSEITLAPPMKKAIELAVDESRKLGHSHVGTEHLLLAIVRQSESIAAKVLGGLGVDLEKVRHQVIATLGQPHREVGASAPESVPPQVFSTHPQSTGQLTGPFDRFTDSAKRVLALAQDEAMRFRHNYIGTEHLLLGLIREQEGVAARALQALGAELVKARTAVGFIIGEGEAVTTPSDITLSPRTKKVIELAIDEARKLGHGRVGTEHLLLGLAREGEGIASGVLESLGITMDKVRRQVIEALGQSKLDARGQAPFDLIDDVSKRVLAIAEEEARQMRHNWIGTEHVLIALVRHGMSRTLHQLGVTLDLARAGVFKFVPPKETEITDIALTPRVRTLLGKAIMLAAPGGEKARPHHLLLALVDDPAGIGARVLDQLGATADKVQVAIAKETSG
jgi:ATP-dependent Clp protease ATP-binding subunit ClpA